MRGGIRLNPCEEGSDSGGGQFCSKVMRRHLRNLFCSGLFLNVLDDPRVGHVLYNIPPSLSVLHQSQQLLHSQSCPSSFHPFHFRSAPCSTTRHVPLYKFFLQVFFLLPYHNVRNMPVCSFLSTPGAVFLFPPCSASIHLFLFSVHDRRSTYLRPAVFNRWYAYHEWYARCR